MTKSSTYDDATLNRLRALAKSCPTWPEARALLGKELGSHPDNVTRLNRRHQLWSPVGGGTVTATAATSDAFTKDVETSKAATLDEVISLCGVDTTKWESKGFNVRRGANGFAWSARFARRKEPVDVEALVTTFVEHAAAHAPRKWPVPVRLSKEADCLFVLNIQDAHLGKLAHGDSTGGADWDTRIAERVYRETVIELIAKVPSERVEEVVVIVGSDMLQIDTDQSTTTAGTYVDSDSRLSKVFDTAGKLLTDVIEQLAARFKVRAVVVRGNHDATTSHFLGRYVEAWFRSHPNVTVDSSAKSRKYVGYGKTLIGFDHGDATKLKDLPLVVMRENQSTISQYQWVEVLTGHRHIEASEDMKGIVVRTAPALCSPDVWHSEHGYVGTMRRSQGLLYSRNEGLQAIYYSRALD